MSGSSAVQRVLARVAQGDAVPSACALEGVVCRSDVVVDAHYDGKPVCTLTLPWVVDGHALLFDDASVAESVAQERLASLASALNMPICVIPRAAA